MRRVVVTGMGMVTPLGCGVEPSWRRLLAGESGARKVDTLTYPTCRAGSPAWSRAVTATMARYNPDRWMEPKEQRKVDDFIVYAMCAARQAIEDSGCAPKTHDEQIAIGVLIGSGIGGIGGIAETAIVLKERGPRRVSPFFIPGRLINLASGYVSIAHGLKGPNHAVVTACSTGAHAIGDAARLIALGDAELMVAGGAESPINRLSMAGFAACRALSTGFNDDPPRGSRPYDRDRDGFVIAEGAGVVVLEELEHARGRNAQYLCRARRGMACRGTRPMSPPRRRMETAPIVAWRRRYDVPALPRPRLIISTATEPRRRSGTRSNCHAVHRLVGNAAGRISMSSTKSSTGHLLGAAGAVEAIFSILAMRDGIAPPTINLDNPSIETAIDLVPLHAKPRTIDVVLSNSFGFGGTNASLVFRRCAG